VWTVPTKPFKGAHFATYPPALIEPCILAGSPEEGIILDPFFGAGTTGLVALENNRQYIGCEINPEYIEIAKERLKPVVKSIENEKISTSIVNEYFKF
jgi:DNA modification methylase